MFGEIKPIQDAPKDRPILIRLKKGIDYDKNEEFIVAHYAEWGSSGPYLQVWETDPGCCLFLNCPDILGWYELPT